MDTRKTISKNSFFKKYILSWLLPVIFFLVKSKVDDSFLTQILFLLSIVQGFFYLGLKKVSYDDEKVYLSNKTYDLDRIEDFHVLDQKISLFFVLKISERQWFNKYVWFELKDMNIASIVKRFLGFKSNINLLEEFISLLKLKSNIPNEKKNKI